MATASEKAMSGATGQFSVFELNFYHSLVLTALHPDASSREQDEYREKLESNQQQLKMWAGNCKENFAHAYDLVCAEMARIGGRDLEAMTLYDRAIESAAENGFVQNEALANELAAKFWSSRGKDEFADIYLKRADAGYRRWGAMAKVADLEEQHPQLLSQPPSGTPSASSAVAETRDPLSSTGSEALDYMTVVKAAQTLSSEVVLDQLLKKLMKIVIENAGAQKGFLVLEHDGQLAVEAEGSVDPEDVILRQSTPLDSLETSSKNPMLSKAIVNYVAESKEKVLLDDTTAGGMFATDAYITENNPKSILCMPILHQGKLTGILYLENNLTTGAFTTDRLQILDLLSSQIAISIENALLYLRLEDRSQALEHEVNERTQELRKTRHQLSETRDQVNLKEAASPETISDESDE